MLCPQCTFDSPAGLRHCPACGYDLGTVPTPPAYPPSSPAAGYLGVPLSPSGGYPQVPPPAGYPPVPLAPSGAYPQVPLVPSGSYPTVPPPAPYPPPPQPGYGPHPGYAPQPGSDQPGYGHQPGYGQQPGYSPAPYPVSAVPGAPGEQRSSHTLLVVLVCLGVVAILALGVVLAVHLVDRPTTVSGGPGANPSASHPGTSGGGPSTPASTGPTADEAAARAQAVALDQLLSTAMASRGQLAAALNQANGCGDLYSALNQINSVVAARQSQVQQATNLDLSALDNGPALHQALESAWNLSLQADLAYGRWVQWMINYGTCGTNADRTDADAYSNQSHGPKDQFIALWNPIATHFGLPTRAQTDI